MKQSFFRPAVGVTALALALGLLTVTGTLTAADESEAKGAILKLAGMVEKEADARKEAGEVAKKVEIEEVMKLFKLRSRGGLGFGDKPGATPNQDGIEAKLIALGR